MKYRSIICTIILVMVLSITVGFSAFVSEMSISNIVADVRVEKDVRITDVEVLNDRSNNITVNDVDYSSYSVLSDIMFYDTSSYVTYKVTVTNFGNTKVCVHNLFLSDTRFDYLVVDGDFGYNSMICDDLGKCTLGVSTDIIVVIRPSSTSLGEQKYKFEFDIREYYSITFKNIDMDSMELIGGDMLSVVLNGSPTNVKVYCDGILASFGSDYNYQSGTLDYYSVWGDIVVEGEYEYEYGFTGGYQTFIAPVSGKYKIELWGAQGGGDGSFIGGKGAYTSGEIDLSKNTELYVYVGQYDGGFNNGGYTRWYEWLTNSGYFYAGGGATDVRLKSGSWDLFDGLKSRIMVAAGGGGAVTYYTYQHGGSGGGLIGYDGAFVGADGRNATGGTQTSGGEIGIVSLGNAYFGKAFYDTVRGLHSIGGSGYYAGGSGSHGANTIGSGAGGSSYISGHNGCNSIAELSTESLITHTGNSIHYSGYGFTNTKMIDGEGYQWTTAKSTRTGMPSKSDGSPVIGNEGDGYAKITFIE